MRAANDQTQITVPVRLPTDKAGNALPDPLSAYKVSDNDDATDPQYCGYLAADGAWCIMKTNIAARSFRYAAGRSGYTTAWANRASLAYDYFDVIF